MTTFYRGNDGTCEAVENEGALFKRCVAKIDFTSACLQIREAKRDVHRIPPSESHDRAYYWLLFIAAYGLGNANAKLQEHSDTFCTVSWI